MSAVPNLLCLLFAIFLAQPRDSQACTSGDLLDSTTTMAATQPNVAGTLLRVKLKIIDPLTISSIVVNLTNTAQPPAVASLHNVEANGSQSAMPFYRSNSSQALSATTYQIDMANPSLSPGFCWLVFTGFQDGDVVSGWTWGEWSGEDYFHSLSFAEVLTDGNSLRMVIKGLTSALPVHYALSRLAFPNPNRCTIGLRAEFEPSQAAFRLSGTFGGQDQAQHGESSVDSRLSSLHLGNITLLAADLAANTTREIVPDRGGASVTYIYSVGLDDSTQLRQSFTFHKSDTNATFAGVDFDIPANSVKWSLNFTSISSSHTQPTTVSYRLNGTGLVPARDARIARRSKTPVAGLTTYFLPLNSDSAQSIVATVVLFDVAVVDGVVTTVRHSITATAGEYEVVVELPPFEEWVHYDPGVGMGALLGSDGGGGSDNTGVIIGVAVAVPVAVVVVVAAIAAGVVFVWFKQRSQWVASTVNFSDTVHDQLAGEL